MDIAAAITTASQALGLAKELRDIDKGIETGELKSKMSDLYVAVSDLKIALADAREEILSLEQKNAELAESFNFQKDLIEHNGYKYEAFEGKPAGMPYCPVCEKKEGKFFILTRKRGVVMFACPSCKSEHHGVSSFTSKQQMKRNKAQADSAML